MKARIVVLACRTLQEHAALIHPKAIPGNFILENYRNEEMKLRGKLRRIASPFGASGAFGDLSEGFIQNGFDRTA
jgi:hypothetical protein